MSELILIRHGQSLWNLENRYTGWTDVGLTQKGVDEARLGGRLLRESLIMPDVAFTSMLRRAIRSLWIILDEIDCSWLPAEKDWRLNERHYGTLQSFNKKESEDEFGLERVYAWRRSFSEAPPPMDWDDPRHPRFDPRYASVAENMLPASESLADTLKRVLACWEEKIVPALLGGRVVLLVAHGNSLRALIKHLDGISDGDIPALTVPTGIPRRYRFGAGLDIIERGYLGDAELVRAATEAATWRPERIVEG